MAVATLGLSFFLKEIPLRRDFKPVMEEGGVHFEPEPPPAPVVAGSQAQPGPQALEERLGAGDAEPTLQQGPECRQLAHDRWAWPRAAAWAASSALPKSRAPGRGASRVRLAGASRSQGSQVTVSQLATPASEAKVTRHTQSSPGQLTRMPVCPVLRRALAVFGAQALAQRTRRSMAAPIGASRNFFLAHCGHARLQLTPYSYKNGWTEPAARCRPPFNMRLKEQSHAWGTRSQYDWAGQRPWNSGFRFSAKARRPSL